MALPQKVVPSAAHRITRARADGQEASKGTFALMILISSAILGVVLLTTPQAPDQRAAAERLANSGDYADALKQFQSIAAANPDDIEARLWIARLHAQLGHPEHAVDVYQSILAVQPQHLDALIGARAIARRHWTNSTKRAMR